MKHLTFIVKTADGLSVYKVHYSEIIPFLVILFCSREHISNEIHVECHFISFQGDLLENKNACTRNVYIIQFASLFINFCYCSAGAYPTHNLHK